MARISTLPAAGALAGDEAVPVNQDGETRVATATQFAALVAAAFNVALQLVDDKVEVLRDTFVWDAEALKASAGLISIVVDQAGGFGVTDSFGSREDDGFFGAWAAGSQTESRDDFGSTEPHGPNLSVDWSSEDAIAVTDGLGSVLEIEFGPRQTVVSGAGEHPFSTAEMMWAEGIGAEVSLFHNSQDLSDFAGTEPGANLDSYLGQSFDAGSDMARLYMTDDRVASLGFQHNTWAPAGEPRCVMTGSTWVAYNADTRELARVREAFVKPTNVDGFYDADKVRDGDYPLNARGGTPHAVASWVADYLTAKFYGRADAVPDSWAIALSCSKTDGTLAEVGGLEGTARSIDSHRVFEECVEAAAGAAPSTVDVGEIEPRHCRIRIANHGEADEGLSSDFEGGWHVLDQNLHNDQVARWGQAKRAMLAMLQNGGPKYSSATMNSSTAMARMARDHTGSNRHVFVIGCKGEVMSLYNLSLAQHVNGEDGHPILPGNVVMGIRIGIAIFMLTVLKQPVWCPYIERGLVRGRWILAVVPTMRGGVRTAAMPYGCDIRLPADHNLSIDDAEGVANKVLSVQTVPGFRHLVLIECEKDVDAAGFVTAGEGGIGPDGKRRQGAPCFRDDFDIELPIRIDVDANQIQFGRSVYVEAEPARGWVDTASINGMGRFAADGGPGFTGRLDLGNPMLRDVRALEPMPVIA